MPIKIVTYDIDYAGHVSNTSYVRWLEDMRFHFLENYYPMEHILERKLFPVVVETHVFYKKPLNLFDACIGSMWISGFERFRYTIRAIFSVDAVIHAEAEHHMAFIDTTTLRPQRIPQDMLEMIETHTIR